MGDQLRSELSSSYLTACATPTTRPPEANDGVQFAEEQPLRDNDEKHEDMISTVLDFEDESAKVEDEPVPNDSRVKVEEKLVAPPDEGQVGDITEGISAMLSPMTASSSTKLKQEEKLDMQVDGFGADFMNAQHLNAKEEEHIEALISNPNVDTGRTSRLPRGRSKFDNQHMESQKQGGTVPSGPTLHTQRRALSYRSSATHSSTSNHVPEKDPVEQYRPGATIPKAPRLHVERRISQTAALRRAEENARAVELGKNAAVIARRRTSKPDTGVTKPRRTSLLALSRVDSHAKHGTRRSRNSVASRTSDQDDHAKSYQLVPTKPMSPHFRSEVRTAAHRTADSGHVLKPSNGAFRRAAEKLAEETDLAKIYKLEPTKSVAPKFRIDERLSAKNVPQNTIQPKNDKKKKTVDFTENYELKPTLPTSPHLTTEQRLGSHYKNPSSCKNPSKIEETTDAALMYKMEPTIPKSPRLSHLPTAAFSAKPKVEGEAVQVDFASTYKLERTIPVAYRLSTAKPKPSKTTLSPAGPVKQQPFRARPMPVYSEVNVKQLQRRHSMKNIGKQPDKIEQKMRKVEPPLTRTIPMKHQLESEKRHEEYVARMNIRRSVSQGSLKRSSSQPAEIRPFHLESVARHEAAMEELNRKIAAEKEENERRRRFKAGPLYADMLEGPTFKPLLGLVPTTTPRDVITASRERAALRAEYDERNAVRMATYEQQKEEARAIREKEEYERIAARRTVFRARPVPASLYRAPAMVVTPRTSKNKGNESTNNDGTGGADDAGVDASGGYSPKELIAGVRRALSRLGSPV